ncbi:MAG: ATP-binding protein [Pseudomonadota bacterium]
MTDLTSDADAVSTDSPVAPAPAGQLVDVSEGYFIARLNDHALERPGAQEGDSGGSIAGRVGSHLIVRSAGKGILVSVARSYDVAGEHGNNQIMAQLTPMGMIDHTGRFSRGIAHYPDCGAEVHTISGRQLAQIFSSYGDEDLSVGTLATGAGVSVHLDASAFFGRHAAILGQSGSGKSWTVTSLIQSTLGAMPNAHIIVLDMHGEYGEKDAGGARLGSPFAALNVRTFSAGDVEFPYWLLSFADLCELLINPSDGHASIQTSFLRDTLLRLRRESNTHLDVDHITVDSPLYYPLDELREAMEDADIATADFGREKLDTYGKFDQPLIRLGSLLNDSRYDFMMRPSKRTSSDSLSDLMKDLVGLGQPRANVTVIDLSSVAFDVVPFVTAQIGRLVYEFNFWNPRCTEFPIFLICEEAHEYIPREEVARFREARRAMERISKNGRKYGVGLCVISQRPHEISETVLAQCSSFLCLRISNPEDQEYVRSMVPEASRGTFDTLTSLAKGEVIALGEAVPMPVRFRVDPPSPPPNSTDIDFSQKWRDEDIAIDVDALVGRWRSQDHH